MKRNKSNSNKGFTLMELLIVVGIMAVLAVVAFIAISPVKKQNRQTELDSKAEVIYHAAQNHMIELLASGNSDVYNNSSIRPLEHIPSDAVQAGDGSGEDPTIGTYTLYYVANFETGIGDVASDIVLESMIDEELYIHKWIIEFDPTTGGVYAVFYCEGNEIDSYIYDSSRLDNYRNKDNRIKNGATIGYYGGELQDTPEEVIELEPKVDFNNSVHSEKCYATVYCESPNKDVLDFTVKVTDSSGNEQEVQTTPIYITTSKTYYATIFIDCYDGSGQFKNNYSQLVPGDNITIELTVTSDTITDENNKKIEYSFTSESVNPLFDRLSDDGTEAEISCVRHLQNLNCESSGVNKNSAKKKTQNITKAKQTSHIDITSEEAKKYFGEDYIFTPITNSYLTFYGSDKDGTVFDIENLTVDTQGDAGLFTSFSGNIKGIRLINAKCTGKGNVGALVGTITGDSNITDCGVYFEVEDLKAMTGEAKYQNKWITGNVAGGLIGSVASGTATISGSLAATVVSGTTVAGGLVGDVNGTVNLSNSYADCYIYGNISSGLVGRGSGVSIDKCYSAGYISATGTNAKAAGLCYGSVSCATNSYSACYFLPTDAAKTFSGQFYPTVMAASKSQNLYYLENQGFGTTTAAVGTGKSYDDLVDLDISGFEKKEISETLPYDWMGQNLTGFAYSYPGLKNLIHYGDWVAKIEYGKLVYYEKYADGSVGYYGANGTDKLDEEKSIVEDGYAILYDSEPEDELKFTYQTGASEAMSSEKTLKKGTSASTDLSGEQITGRVISATIDKEDIWLLVLPPVLTETTYEDEDFYQKLTVGDDVYYYNPHYAMTVVSGAVKPDAPKEIYIRTARQLRNMSLYYETSRAFTKSCAFVQSKDIDYTAYSWTDSTTLSEAPETQAPIGDSQSFQASYNGGCHVITGISIQSETGYAGLFGNNAGTIKNVVLDGKYDADASEHLSITFKEDISNTAHIGTLVGYNSGTVSNCAVCGYTITAVAVKLGNASVGGLVGYNKGSISLCSAEAPAITVSGTSATVNCGGFVGNNAKTVTKCYAIGKIEALTAVNGTVSLAGFAGANSGSISTGYCLTSLTSAGSATLTGFAAKGSGSNTDCYYLNQGTYKYLNKLMPYTDGVDTSGMTEAELNAYNNVSKQYDDLTKVTISDFTAITDGTCCLSHNNTDDQDTQTEIYPFPAVVTNASGATVHYGDWPVKADVTVGVFYWEKEGSSYKVSYEGYDLENNIIKGSTLCEEHSDDSDKNNHEITEYGYGYFYTPLKEGSTGSVTKTLFKFAITDPAEDSTVESRMKTVLPGYTVVAYDTIDPYSEDDTAGLYLKGTSANGTLLITYKESGSSTVYYKFAISPFFADSFQCLYHGVTKEPSSDPTIILGTEEKPYSVRNQAQLQFINWNGYSEYYSATKPVYTSKYSYFAYLQYAGATETATQSSTNTHPKYYWKQTHDITGTSNFVPIAGRDSKISGASAVLYAWFGGSYDGQGYMIRNVGIDTTVSNVGIFGTTVGAQLKNIILYSDSDTVIRRSGTEKGSYAIGGLVGYATDYSGESSACIEGCAIGGYIIKDETTQNSNAMGTTGVSIGGLVGSANVRISKCAAVTEINAESNHTFTNTIESTNYTTVKVPSGGNFIRIGGLAGSCTDVSDCYTGGEIKIGEVLYKECTKSVEYGNTDTYYYSLIGENDGQLKVTKSTNIYIYGIGGTGSTVTFKNITNSTELTKGNVAISNCYTYMTFPEIKGTVRAVSMIGSMGDRYADTTGTISIANSYYLNTSATSLTYSNSICYTYKANKEVNPYYSTLKEDYGIQLSKGNGSDKSKVTMKTLLGSEKYRTEMLNGDLRCLVYFFKNHTDEVMNKADSFNVTSKSYEEMADSSFAGKLGSAFEMVSEPGDRTVSEDQFSFPKGGNYPFPCVISRMSSKKGYTETTCYYHYGEWSEKKLTWAESEISFNILDEYNEETGEAAITTHASAPDANAYGLKVTVSGDSVSHKATDLNGSEFAVTFTALKTGTSTVKATYGSYTDTMTITVTADMKAEVVSVEETQNEESTSYYLNETDVTAPEMVKGETYSYKVKAVSVTESEDEETGNITTTESEIADGLVTWAITYGDQLAESRVVSAEIEEGYQYNYQNSSSTSETYDKLDVKGKSSGSEQMVLTGTFTYNGVDYTTSCTLDISVEGNPTVGISSNGSFAEVTKNTIVGDTTSYETNDTLSAASLGDLYIYLEGAEKTIDSYNSDGKITITATDNASRTYPVTVGAVGTVDIYTYLPLTVDVSNMVDVTDLAEIEIKVTMVIDEKTYELSIEYVPEMVTVTYKDDGTEVETITVPKGSLITLRAYPNENTSCWALVKESIAETMTYTAGTQYRVTEDTVFSTAQ